MKNVNRPGGNEIANLNARQIADGDAPKVAQSSVPDAAGTKIPVGKPGEGRPATGDVAAGQRIADASRETGTLDAGRQLSSLGGVSATDKLLGLDLRPTMTGVLASPPGNVEFLRHLTPQARRTIMRKMLAKQRERMRRLARYVRERRDEEEGGAGEGGESGESFIEVIAEPVAHDRQKVARATAELEKAARMLNILDEMLAMQDYTISQMGTFAQG